MCGWLITLADDNYHVVSFLLNIENRVHHYYAIALQYVLIKIIYEKNISTKDSCISLPITMWNHKA